MRVIASQISRARPAAGQVSPPGQAWEVRQVLRGIRRTWGVNPRQKRALVVEQLRQLIQATQLGDARARATALFGSSPGRPYEAAQHVDIGAPGATTPQPPADPRTTLRSYGRQPRHLARLQCALQDT